MPYQQAVLGDIAVVVGTVGAPLLSAMRAVEAWVKKGGTLLTTSGAATADRLNDTSTILRNLTGIVEKPRPRLNINVSLSCAALASGSA